MPTTPLPWYSLVLTGSIDAINASVQTTTEDVAAGDTSKRRYKGFIKQNGLRVSNGDLGSRKKVGKWPEWKENRSLLFKLDYRGLR